MNDLNKIGLLIEQYYFIEQEAQVEPEPLKQIDELIAYIENVKSENQKEEVKEGNRQIKLRQIELLKRDNMQAVAKIKEVQLKLSILDEKIKILKSIK